MSRYSLVFIFRERIARFRIESMPFPDRYNSTKRSIFIQFRAYGNIVRQGIRFECGIPGAGARLWPAPEDTLAGENKINSVSPSLKAIRGLAFYFIQVRLDSEVRVL
jgi:hypothetical protein